MFQNLVHRTDAKKEFQKHTSKRIAGNGGRNTITNTDFGHRGAEETKNQSEIY